MSDFIYGLDFGTSNSTIAVFDLKSQSIVARFSEASIIYFWADGKEVYSKIGRKALEAYLANAQDGRLMKSIKSVLPSKAFKSTRIYTKAYQAEDLAALIISYLKSLADEFTGQKVKRVIMGRPVVFDENLEKDQLAQKRLLSAAQLSGFDEIYFQYEPIAAAFHYERTLTKSETVLVGDFGAGTSDFSLMELKPNQRGEANRFADMLGKGGIHIGGDDFDSAVMWHELVPYFGFGLKYLSHDKWLDLPLYYYKMICSWEEMNFFKSQKIKEDLEYYYIATQKNEAIARLSTLVNENQGYGLFRAIEQAKINLSNQEESKIKYFYKNIDINQSLNIRDFNRAINKELTELDEYLDSFLQTTIGKKQEIDTVFLTGGSSQVSSIRETFARRFGDEAIQSGDHFESVANGLAYSSILFL